MDTGDWRAQLPLELRKKMISELMAPFMRHLPFSGDEGLQETFRIAKRFEEKMYAAATSQTDYLRRIGLKILSKDSGFQPQEAMSSSLPSESSGTGNNLPRSRM